MNVCVCMCVCSVVSDSDPMDCSLPGASVCGILQARILEWVAISSSRDLPDPGMEPVPLASPAVQVDSLLLASPGSLRREIDYFGTLSKILTSINICF